MRAQLKVFVSQGFAGSIGFPVGRAIRSTTQPRTGRTDGKNTANRIRAWLQSSKMLPWAGRLDAQEWGAGITAARLAVACVHDWRGVIVFALIVAAAAVFVGAGSR